MSIAHVVPAEMWGGINHWAAGAGVLILLLATIGALLAFGAGREHS